MKKSFTKKQMTSNRGCYSLEDLQNCSFMKTESDVTLESILKSEIKLKDKFWFVCKKIASKEQNKKIAIAVAEIVLSIYEKKYPDSKAPREAIQAAMDFMAGLISIDQLRDKQSAADADAADAAYAYAAAADAAYAYAAAADADAADAAYAYAAAADAAYAYAAYAYAAYAYAAADAADVLSKSKVYIDLLFKFLVKFCEDNF